jgi:hypothetical protein
MKWSIAGATVGGLLTGTIMLLRARPTKVNVIRYRDLMEWFTKRTDVKIADPDNVAFTLLRRPAKYAEPHGSTTRVGARPKAPVLLLQGIYNSRTKAVVEYRAIKATELDEDVADTHRDNELVIYK